MILLEIFEKFADIVKFLKKEYKNITKESVTLSEVAPVDMMVQSTSRVRSWVQASKQYSIGQLKDVVAVRRPSGQPEDRPHEKVFRDFLELASDKRPSNDTSTKNPETPEA